MISLYLYRSLQSNDKFFSLIILHLRSKSLNLIFWLFRPFHVNPIFLFLYFLPGPPYYIILYIMLFMSFNISTCESIFFFIYLFDELLIIYFGTQFHCLLNNFVIFFTPYKEISNLKWFLDTNVDITHYINLRFELFFINIFSLFGWWWGKKH